MRAEILGGDFPKGAVLSPSGMLEGDVEIRWAEGWLSKSESLRNKVENIELMDKGTLAADYTGGGLTPVEGGIIGGSVAGYEGFLAGYLSLPDMEETVLFTCHLSDGRFFIAVSDIEMYNLISSI